MSDNIDKFSIEGFGSNASLHDRLVFYFKDLVETAVKDVKFNPNPDSMHYVVNLLATAVHTEKIFFPKVKYNGVDYDEMPIALQYLGSLESPDYARLGTMKRIGDYSLFVVGFFPESLKRRHSGVTIDYYMSLGSSAYAHLSWSSDDLFRDLSSKFPEFCEALWIVSGNDRKKRKLLDNQQMKLLNNFKPELIQ